MTHARDPLGSNDPARNGITITHHTERDFTRVEVRARQLGLRFGLAVADLSRVLKNAQLFTSRDDTLLVLMSIHLEVAVTGTAQTGGLTVTATNRYILSKETPALHHDVPTRPGVFQFYLEDAQNLVKILPKARGEFPPVIMEVTEEVTETTWVPHDPDFAGQVPMAKDAVTGRVMTVQIHDHPAPRVLEFPERADAPYPDMSEHFRVPPGPVWAIAFNPKLMATFGRVQPAYEGKDTPMEMTFSTPTKPATIRIGSEFTGIIMPIRLAALTERTDNPAPPANSARTKISLTRRVNSSAEVERALAPKD